MGVPAGTCPTWEVDAIVFWSFVNNGVFLVWVSNWPVDASLRPILVNPRGENPPHQ